jgi:hypothetical protein
MKKIIKVVVIILFLAIAIKAEAAQIGESKIFNVDASYDDKERSEITAALIKTSSYLYFYIDNDWWNELPSVLQEGVKTALNDLAGEFEERIYPKLTLTFGSEWRPGIDDDSRITILIHPMIKDAGGYFNNGDEYSKTQHPDSNEREMIYLNSKYLTTKRAKSLLAHEFVHLISFNQKERIYGASEEIWLNEARAEYAPTLLGYDKDYIGSNLQSRVNNFLEKPYDSLTEWRNKSADYGVINLFIQYLVDHYGEKILADSLKSSEVGIPSLNKALAKNGFKEDFSQIFTNWTVAVFVNNCQIAEKYCYLNENLKDLKITPFYNFVPTVGQSTLSVVAATKDWTGNWYKFIGGNGQVLKLEFSTLSGVNFKIPYLIEDSEKKLTINFLDVNPKQKQTIYIEDFGKKNVFLTIIPSIQSKISGFNGLEQDFTFSWEASTIERTPEQEEQLIKELLAKIAILKTEIAEIQAKINAILASRGQISCQRFEKDLYFGVMNSSEVRCLQEFLKNQGSEIYPEGLITGNFLSLTQAAIIRFQEKYANEILKLVGLEKGTGYVGLRTRAKINQLLGY